MIKDKTELENIRKEWIGVREFQAKIQRHLNVGSVGGMFGCGSTHELRNISHNLILLFGFSVLEKVLNQMRSEGFFNAPNTNLGTLMYESKKNLTWINFSLVDQARNDRNELAHDQKIFNRGKCWNYIDAIETELISWKILTSAIPFKH